ARLVQSKRVDTVIRAIAKLASTFDCALAVMGDGPLLGELSLLANQLGIGSRVHFCGWQENPMPLVARASVCVVSSDYEGFSNSVLEAMFLDVPVVTSYCSSDAREMW